MPDNEEDVEATAAETLEFLRAQKIISSDQFKLRFMKDRDLTPGPDTERIVCRHRKILCPHGKWGRAVNCTIYHPDGTVEEMPEEIYCPS